MRRTLVSELSVPSLLTNDISAAKGVAPCAACLGTALVVDGGGMGLLPCLGGGGGGGDLGLVASPALLAAAAAAAAAAAEGDPAGVDGRLESEAGRVFCCEGWVAAGAGRDGWDCLLCEAWPEGEGEDDDEDEGGSACACGCGGAAGLKSLLSSCTDGGLSAASGAGAGAAVERTGDGEVGLGPWAWTTILPEGVRLCPGRASSGGACGERVPGDEGGAGGGLGLLAGGGGAAAPCGGGLVACAACVRTCACACACADRVRSSARPMARGAPGRGTRPTEEPEGDGAGWGGAVVSPSLNLRERERESACWAVPPRHRAEWRTF